MVFANSEEFILIKPETGKGCDTCTFTDDLSLGRCLGSNIVIFRIILLIGWPIHKWLQEVDSFVCRLGWLLSICLRHNTIGKESNVCGWCSLY